jgi:hypothetical protein
MLEVNHAVRRQTQGLFAHSPPIPQLLIVRRIAHIFRAAERMEALVLCFDDLT